MNVGFPGPAEDRAKSRQDGDCAACGAHWRTAILGRGSVWFVHPLVPFEEGGGKTADNCVILCGEAFNNCHLKIGHGGDANSKPRRINKEEVRYFRGKKIDT